MRARATVRAAVVIGSLTALVAAGCASGGGAAKKMSADEAIAARQKLMKDQGAAFKAISDAAKAGQTQAIPAQAQKLAATAREIPALFPQGSVNPATSRAKPEIWQKWADFKGTAKTLESKATQLAATAQGGNAAATNAAVADLGKTTCGSCHDSFRGPEIKK
jgi:cytochrome c556